MSVPPVETFARQGGFHYVYAEAAERGYVTYLRTIREIEEFGDVEYDEQLENIKSINVISGLEAVVFSAMCFEAAIYDFAALHLGDEYVRRHIDRLDVVSKWLLVLRFVTGVDLPKDEAPYGALKNLITERNRLVHAKSEKYDFESPGKQFERWEKREREFESNVHNALRAIIIMSLFLDEVLGDYHNPLPAYDELNVPMRRYYDDLKDVIDECRQVVGRLGGG